MSSRSSSVGKKDKHEKQFLEFLLKLLQSSGGSLQLQKILGHLPKLNSDVKSTIGIAKSDLLYFLKRHNNVFSEKNGIVKIIDSSIHGGYDSDSSGESQPELPSKIEKGKGVIIKIFPRYGFIKAKVPVKTVVYFRSVAYGDEEIDLTSCLYIGAMVYFHATKKNNDNRSKYSATAVWKTDEYDSNSSLIVKKAITRKNRDSGLYDPMTLDSEGIVQKVFPNLGFIAVKGDENNTVFFHKNRLMKYENIVDLTKVLSKGDLVEFSAHRSTKQDTKARWEATKVWKKSKESCGSIESDKSHGNNSSSSKIDMKCKPSPREMIKNQSGKICPRSQGAVIKFGQNELADGDASIYYISGCKVEDISWEFCEGDNVLFDAVKIKSAPGWKAVLVWVGEKPDIVLPTCLGDFSEFTDDETEDNHSTYLSYSSNSSLKSEGSSFKTGKMKKEIPNQSNSSVSTVDKSNSTKEKLHPSNSRYSSQNSLSSYVTTSSQRSKKKHKVVNHNKGVSAKSKIASCWGDSPYPGEDEDNINIAADSYDSNSPSMSNHKKVPKVPNKEIQRIKYQNSTDKVSKLAVPESNTKAKEVANVKKFKCIEGEIVKVYTKYAEVKAKDVETIFSFYWIDFYIDGMSVEELELDDLKQVLKDGDKIHFNYFEIIDDSSRIWHKISLAWKDSQPKNITEVTPEDFIRQHDLSVSKAPTMAVNNEEENNVLCKKYLAVTDLVDELDDKVSSESSSEEELNISEDNLSVSELQNKIQSAISEDNLSVSELQNKIQSAISEDNLSVSELQNTIQSAIDYKSISSAVIEILKEKFSPNTKVDYNSISEEVINVVLESCDSRKFDGKFCQTLSQNENTTPSNTCAKCGQLLVLKSDENINTKISEVQTIITGEIIAQNIFTEC